MSCFIDYLSSIKNKKMIQKNSYSGKPSEEFFNPNAAFDLSAVSVVTKKKGVPFTVLNLSDVHFTDYRYIMETAPKRSIPTPLTVLRLIKKVKPDLITVTGDIVCGKSTVYSIANFTCLMERFGIPWAPVFGNHDGEGNCDWNYLADVMMSAPHCLMKKGDARMGVGNYAVAVKNEDGDITNSFIMMDANRHYDCVGQSDKIQSQWLRWVTDGINDFSKGKARCSVFMHIPWPEYIDAYKLNFDTHKNTWKAASKSVGHLGEEIACHTDKDGKPIQDGFFEIIKESKITRDVFCGHDHLNAFSVPYEGIRLNYVMKISKSAGRQPGYDGGLAIKYNPDGTTELDYKTVSYGFMRSAYKIKY